MFDGLASKVDRLFRQPPPSTEGVALLGDARDVAPRVRDELRARGRPDRARLVVTSPPYLRVVKYGYYNWLRTWFLGFDAPRPSTPPSMTPTIASRTSRSCATCSPDCARS